MGITTKSIGKHWQSVKVFNECAGNLDTVDDISVDNQIGFIFSELEETITGFEARDAVELLDGACDLFVTVAGLMQKLEVAGFNVDEALARVNSNNLSKFLDAEKFSPFSVLSDLPLGHTVKLNRKHNLLVIKDENDKVRKPKTFVPVDVSDLAPTNFFTSSPIGYSFDIMNMLRGTR